MEVPQSIRSNIFTPLPNTETTFYEGVSLRFLFFCTPRSTCSNNLIRHARSGVFENSKCSSEEGIRKAFMRDRGSPHGEGRAWRGHISATQMPHKYLSPPHIFSQISTPESKRKLLGRNLFRKCLKVSYPIPALFVFQVRRAAFLMIVGKVEEITWSVSWPAHQRQSVNREFLNAQTTNICSHRATEWEKNKNKQEEKRENRRRS